MHFLINERTISKVYEVPTDLDNLNKASTISGGKAEAGEKEEEEVEEGGEKEEKQKVGERGRRRKKKRRNRKRRKETGKREK